MNEAPRLFITGSSRAGTELLRSILNGHSSVFIAQETHYFADLRPRLADRRGEAALTAAFDYFVRLRGSAYGLNGAETKRSQADLHAELLNAVKAGADRNADADAVFFNHCRLSAQDAGRPAPRVWGEKTPRHIFNGADILAAFPQSKIVHMLRDPRAVIASYLDWQNHWYDGREVSDALRIGLAAEARRVKATSSITALALNWSAATAEACALQARLGEARVRLQGFEALVNDPEREIAELCAFVGIVPEPGMAAVALVNSSYAPLDAMRGFDTKTTRRWEERLAPAETWWIERLTRPVAQALGYQPVQSRPHLLFLASELIRATWQIPHLIWINRRRVGRTRTAILSRLRALRQASRDPEGIMPPVLRPGGSAHD